MLYIVVGVVLLAAVLALAWTAWMLFASIAVLLAYMKYHGVEPPTKEQIRHFINAIEIRREERRVMEQIKEKKEYKKLIKGVGEELVDKERKKELARRLKELTNADKFYAEDAKGVHRDEARKVQDMVNVYVDLCWEEESEKRGD